jgi:hypothetical protein
LIYFLLEHQLRLDESLHLQSFQHKFLEINVKAF